MTMTMIWLKLARPIWWLVCWLVLAFVTATPVTAAEPLVEVNANDQDPQQVLVMLNLPPAHFRADGNYSGGYADVAGSSARHRIAASLARAHGLSLVTDWPMPILNLDCYVMEVPAQRRPADVAAQLARDPRVAWAQAMNMFKSLGHDDPLYTLQPAAREWRLDELHATSTGRDVRIAVVDSGVQLDHPDLAGQFTTSANYVGDREASAEIHGTAVAGIIAAHADNHVGIAGVAPRSRLLALRACRQASATDTSCTTLSLALALHAAIERHAQIINMSLGGPPDRLIQQLVEAALIRGIYVVAAVNRSAPNGGFPAGLPGVLAVLDKPMADAPAGTVIAPGTDVPTTLPGSRWATVSGASYAAAHVSGLLALMLDARSNAGIKERKERTADTTAGAGRANGRVANDFVVQPDGRVDACASMARAAAACVCGCIAISSAESIARH